MTNSDEQIQLFSIELLSGITEIIEKSKTKAAVFLNSETTVLYWSIGKFINENLKTQKRTSYGNKIVATLSQQLTNKYGKGFTYTALTRMCKVADCFNPQKIATLSQQLSWSHLIEIATINSEAKREFYVYKCIESGWGIRELRKEIDKLLFERSPIAKLTDYEIKKRIGNTEKSTILNPDLVFKNTYILDFLNLPQTYSENDLENQLVSKIEDFILELGNGFAFLERQKRISIDGEDYHLDLLFYHRKLKRLVAIDLKIGKFKPVYKGQMELYLRWLEKYEMQEGEERPIGLLLCSEGNTEHIELLMLNESEIKVAQFITEFPDKQWFADKLHKAIELTKHQKNN
jgi:predicted nuclease of restriction endonuclease-like (RecB) superfamily